MQLSNKTKQNIINSLNREQARGVYKHTPEHELAFDEETDEDLIYYRDEWLISAYDINDPADVEIVSQWFDGTVDEYYNGRTYTVSDKLNALDDATLTEQALKQYAIDYIDSIFIEDNDETRALIQQMKDNARNGDIQVSINYLQDGGYTVKKV